MQKLQKLSKGYYLVSIIGSFVLIFILSVLAVSSAPNNLEIAIFLIIVLFVVLIYMVVVFARLWYKAWESIQDGYARTTPGAAIGLSFIPIFNFYWVFQLSWGFAKDFNSYIDRHNITTSKLSEGLFLTFAIFGVLNIILSRIPQIGVIFTLIGAIIALIVVNNICDAVNSIRGLHKGIETEAPDLSETRSYSSLFDKKRYGVNYEVGIAFLIASLLSVFTWNLMSLVKGDDVFFFPSNYYIIRVFSSIIISVVFLLASHLVSKNWLLPLVWGGVYVIEGIGRRMTYQVITFDSINFLTSPFDPYIISINFLYAFFFMAGLVLAVYFWGPKLWSFILGLTVCLLVWDVLYEGIQFLVKEYSSSIESMLSSSLVTIIDSILFGVLIYAGYHFHFKQQEKAVDVKTYDGSVIESGT